MKKLFWVVLLIALIPLWAIVYICSLMAIMWEFYYYIYDKAGKPLDKKGE